jgi:hypothetical protein
VEGGRGLGVAEEAGVDPSKAQRQSLAVDLDVAVPQGPDEIVGCVLQGKEVAPVVPPVEVPTATRGSMGQFPSPAPAPAREASTRVTPSSTATTVLATARDRFWWARIPISVSGCSRSR